jgi:alpha-glucosidase
MLELYRAALRIRRNEPSLGMGPLRWLPSAPEVVLFSRGADFACMANLSATPIELPAHRGVLLSSLPIEGDCLPTDATAWFRPA